jgi:beta-lactam-binding protein with PASTA domain
MKKPSKNIWKILLIAAIGLLAFLIIVDNVIMPIYVSGKETIIPNVLGKNKDEAIKILEDAGFNQVIQTSRFDQKYRRDQVIFQKPSSGSVVKINRRIYLTYSGGEPLLRMPSLISKTLRDAQVTLEKLGLTVGKIDSIESEFPENTIVEQQYFEGREIAAGSAVNLEVSVGPKVGMIRVPNILGKSMLEAEEILKSNSLKIGNKTFINSPTLLPNTVVDQQPSENTLLSIGDSVNVVLSQSKSGDEK